MVVQRSWVVQRFWVVHAISWDFHFPPLRVPAMVFGVVPKKCIGSTPRSLYSNGEEGGAKSEIPNLSSRTNGVLTRSLKRHSKLKMIQN